MATTTTINGKRPAELLGDSASTSKRTKLNFGPTVTLKLAESAGREFTVHVDILRNRSTYFRHLIPDPASTKTYEPITIDEKAPRIFRHYLEWIYDPTQDIQGVIVAGTDDVELIFKPEQVDAARLDVTCARLIILWNLADRYGDSECKNRTIEILFHRFSEIVLRMYPHFEEVYASKENSSLRRWLVHCMVAHLKPHNFETRTYNMPVDMYHDVFRAFVTLYSEVAANRRPAVDAAMFYE